MMKEKDIIEVVIDDFDHEGLGIAHIDNKPVFIPNAIPGEKIKAKINRITKNLIMADNLEVLEKSPNREDNICKYYDLCGGCNIMHMKYSYQMEYKTKITERTIKKVSGLSLNVDECVKNRDLYGYRNKIIVPLGYKDGRIISGFYEAKSHNIVEMDNCMIEPKISQDIISFIKTLLEEYKISIYDEDSNSGVMRNIMLRVSSLNDVMVVLVATRKFKEIDDIVLRLTKEFKDIKSIYLNINDKRTNVVLQEKYYHLYGDKYLIEDICGLKFMVHPNSFLQINHYQCENLYNKAIELADIKDSDVVIDAYCGIGSISLNVAKKAKFVYGIEVVPQAIENAKENMKLNNITNAEFICGKCEDEISRLVRDKKIDVIIFDPPRKGCDINFLNTVIKSGIKKIVYISCKTSTFARDIKILTENGYIAKDVSTFDLFSHSVHVESVTLLVKRD